MTLGELIGIVGIIVAIIIALLSNENNRQWVFDLPKNLKY